MATGVDTTDAEVGGTVNKLTCAICLQKYRRPKLLPCFHSFCRSCLQGLAGSSPSFPCPSCRTQILVPEAGGVAAFQNNFYIEEDLEAVSSAPQQRLCDLCAEDREATHKCLQCQQRYCVPCRKTHDAISSCRDHIMMSLTQSEEEGCGDGSSDKGDDQQKTVMCPKHRDQRLLLHCSKCQMDICMQCKLTKHEGHPTDDLADNRAKVKAKLQDILDQVRRQKLRTDQLISAFDDRCTKLKEQERLIEEDFQGRADILHQWVNQSLLEAVTNMKLSSKELVKSWDHEKEQLQNKTSALQAQQNHLIRVLKDGKEADIVSLEAQFSSSPMDVVDVKQVEKELTKDIPTFHVKYDTTSVTQRQFHDFVGALDFIQQAPGTQNLDPACGSVLRNKSVVTGQEKAVREVIYSKNPQSNIEDMCPISHNRVWVRYRIDGSSFKRLLKLLDADGQVLATVKKMDVPEGKLAAMFDDTILTWTYYTVASIKADGSQKSLHCDTTCPYEVYCAGKDQLCLRWKNESKIHFGKFAVKDKLTCLKGNVIFSRNLPLKHVSREAQHVACMEGNPCKKVTIYTKDDSQDIIEAPLASYTPQDSVLDTCFCQISGQEMLLVVVANDNKVHVVDLSHDGFFVGYLDTGTRKLHQPRRLFTDYDQHVWIGCDGGKVVIVDL